MRVDELPPSAGCIVGSDLPLRYRFSVELIDGIGLVFMAFTPAVIIGCLAG